MKPFALLFVCVMIGLFGALEARIFNSTSGGGSWTQPSTWLGGTGLVPGASDDVIIWSPVTVSGVVNCHNLTVGGSTGGLRNHPTADGTVNINGDLSITQGSVIVSETVNGHYISINLYGDFSQNGWCNPLHFNFLGSGDRHLSQAPGSGSSLAPYGNITVANEIDTLFVDTDFTFSTSHASLCSNLTSGASYAIRPADGVQISISNTNLKMAYLRGRGASLLHWENQRDGIVENSTLEGVHITSPGMMMLKSGVTLRDVSNLGTLCNFQDASRNLILEGEFHNYGAVRNNPMGQSLTVTSSGNLYNYAYFKPGSLTLTGSGDRYMACAADHPFSVDTNITIEATVGTIYATSNLYFSGFNQMSGGSFALSNSSREDFDLYLEDFLASSCTFVGGSGSALYASNLIAYNTAIQSFDINGEISFRGGCTLTNVVNHAILQNYNNSDYTLSIQGNFPNYGTLQNHPLGYLFSLNVYGNLQNYGEWMGYSTSLASSAAQSITFGQEHPCKSTYLFDTVLSSTVLAVGDIWFQNCSLDFNNCSLILDSAPSGIHISSGNLRDVAIQSTLENVIDISGTGVITYVGFQSITNNGILTLDSDCTMSGSLINAGTIQNHSNSSRQITVNGNISNSGTIQNNASGYQLTITGKGNITNTGTWTCHQTNLSGTTTQTISFPPAHPFNGAFLTDQVNPSPIVIAAGEDILFNNSTVDMNNCELQMPAGPRWLTINNGNLYDAAVISTVDNVINISGGVISYTNFLGITNAGTLTLDSGSLIQGTLVNNGYIQNNTNGGRILTVLGSIQNNGYIRNNPGGYNLEVRGYGNIVNSGYWNAYTLNLNGNSAQSISFPAEHPFLGVSLNDNVFSSPVVLAGDCYLPACTLDLNGASLNMAQGGTWDLYLNTSILRDALLNSNPGCKLDMAPGGYLTYVGFYDIEFSGTVTFANACTVYRDLLNSGTLQNYSNNHYYLEVYGDVVNNGTITNNPQGWYCYLRLRSDLYNTGQMNCNSILLLGSTGQHFHNSGSFAIAFLTAEVTNDPLYFHDDISLSGTRIDLNNNHLYLNTRQGVTLSCSGEYLRDATIHGGGGATIQGAAGFYLEYVTSDIIEIEGTVSIYGSVFFGTLINHGIINNGLNNNYSLNVSQLLDNRGTITNNTSWNLIAYLQGDLINSGSITCHQVYINGSADQSITRGGTIAPASFYLLSNIGSAQWFLDGEASGYSGSQIAIPIGDTSVLGVWQPYYASTGAWGRHITITSGNDPGIPQGLWIEIAGANAILHWNEAADALSYRIYSSALAQSGFTLEVDNVTDPLPGNGTMEYTLPLSGEKRFYRISALN